MRNSLVAIDAGLARVESGNMLFHAAFSLFHVVHGCVVMAGAAFAGVIFLHPLPYLATPHASNRTGVRAACKYCHVPKALLPKLYQKMLAANDVYQHFMGTIDTPEKFEARRPLLARRAW